MCSVLSHVRFFATPTVAFQAPLSTEFFRQVYWSGLPLLTPGEKGREFQKNIYFCFRDYAKAFDCMDHNKLWKVLIETEIPDLFTCLLRNLYASQVLTVRTGHEQWTGSKLGKEYVKAVYCHSAYLIYMLSVHHEKCWAG